MIHWLLIVPALRRAPVFLFDAGSFFKQENVVDDDISHQTEKHVPFYCLVFMTLSWVPCAVRVTC